VQNAAAYRATAGDCARHVRRVDRALDRSIAAARAGIPRVENRERAAHGCGLNGGGIQAALYLAFVGQKSGRAQVERRRRGGFVGKLARSNVVMSAGNPPSRIAFRAM